MNDPGGLLAVLWRKAIESPDEMAVRAIGPDGVAASLTYGGLYETASRAGAMFAHLGFRRGDRIVISLPTCAEFFSVYLGCLLTGIVPAVTAPSRGASAESIARILHARCIVAEKIDAPLTIAAQDLIRAPLADVAYHPDDDAIAHLQGTSGTTSTPRWAIVRHRNIVANVDAIAQVIGGDETDVLVTWLPMSHDMGLIGVSYAWYHGIPLVAADPANFVRNPLSWLEMISRYRGTLSPAPNSAFQACARIARLRPPKHLDLSRWRVALCGAEPVHAATLHDFQQAFGRFGLRQASLRPVYGLAEATLAATLSPPLRPFHFEHVDAASCAPETVVTPADERNGRGITIVGCGRAIPGHELRIVDSTGRAVADGFVGEIEFRGPSVVDGYFGAEEAGDLVRNGFLRTGDLGYLRDGELFITGRAKEMLIINGRNFSPLQIEATLERMLGASFTPAVVAIEMPDPGLRSGALHILLDARLAGGTSVEARVRQTLADAFGLNGVSLHWIAGGHIPRTASGKIRRRHCRDIVLKNPPAAPPARQSTPTPVHG